jgi:hypothetical protein
LTGGNSTCFGGTDEYSEFADTYLAISPWLEGSSSGSKATMVAPSQGAQLGGATVFFDWNAGFNAQAYWLDVGTSPGSGNLFGRNVGTLTEQTVTNIPVTGGTIYVRLWTQLAGAWQYNDYTYAAPAKATITAPAAGQGLCNAASFTWNTGGGALEYWLDVGTAPGVGNIFGQSVALTTSRSVSGFPSGGALYARLWTRFTSGWYSNDYAYSALACTKGAITSPAPGQLGGSSTTFNWTAGNGATGYWLDVGTTPGQGNIFGQNVGLATSRAVSNIPLTGGTIYVRLFTQLGGVWQWNDYTYSAPAKATLVTPITGSTLCNGTQTFSWNPGAGALEYWLDVGTVSGQGNIFGQNVALTTSRAVTGIPTTGTQFVKLWTRFSSGWVGIDYSFAAASCTKAVMASPAPGTTLTGPTVNFFWTISNGATAYWLDVGTAPGQGNIFGQRIGLPQRQEVGGIPTNGAPVYVRLWSLLGDTWQFNDYTYTASPSSTNAALTNPSSVLSGSTTTFQWNGGASATEYWLDVGTVSGQGNIFGRNVGLATSQLVTGLPTNGSTVFVRLWSKHGGVWDGNSYSFTASSGAVLATLTTPPPGSILSGTAVTFSWNAGAGASAYWLYVGTALGTSDLFNQSMGTSRSVFVSDLPTDGSFIYVRLWTFNTTWNFLDYKLVAGSPISKAVLTSPTAGVMLTGSTVTFSWNAGAGASAYWLDVGSAPGVGNYFGADVGLATSRTVTTLPTNGSPVYVRLWTKLNGVWQSNDYSFTALH